VTVSVSIDVLLSRDVPDDADAIGVAVASDHVGSPSGTAGWPAGWEPDWAFLAHQGFEAKPGQAQVVPGGDGPPIVALGVGPSDEVGTVQLRRAAAALARAVPKSTTLATTLLAARSDGVTPAAAAQAVAEGIHLGAYKYTRYKSEPEPSAVAHLAVVGGGGKPVQAALDRGRRIAEAVCLARDLVNEPGGSLTPASLADQVAVLAVDYGVTLTVMDEAAIADARLGGLLGVNRGSHEPPRFLRISHEPERPRGSLALVGKGITFDSGGLSLKTADGMIGMKGDMGGGAAVIAAVLLAPLVAPRLKVTGYVPCTDNMPGSDAMRVGDVLHIRNGKTVEVLNTDAEGRLVLADALSLACEDEPDAIVDLATLTGACMVALGTGVAGLMGNTPAWSDQVQAAADRAGEDVWPLPLPGRYRPDLESSIADVKNVTGSRYGGALAAGLFLQEFVADGVPWVHLDIAGPAYALQEDVESLLGGTGFGVRTLAELMAGFKKP
jgi:leucyl aminopeptidase